MLKARVGNLILFGLSARNIELLMEGKPILFDADLLGQEFKGLKVAIHYGRTEQAIIEDLDIKVPPG